MNATVAVAFVKYQLGAGWPPFGPDPPGDPPMVIVIGHGQLAAAFSAECRYGRNLFRGRCKAAIVSRNRRLARNEGHIFAAPE